VTAAALAAVLAGCTDSPDSSGRSTPPSSSSSSSSQTGATVAEASLAATLTQSRTDLDTPMINAELTNIGDAPITVASIAVSSPDLATVEPTPKDTTYAPGQIIDLRTPYGRPICESDSLTAATYELTLSDGSTLTLPIDRHGLRWLDGLYRHDCAVRALGQVARVQFAPTASRTTIDGAQYVKASLTVYRPESSRGLRQPFEIRGVSGSVLLRLLPRTPGEFPFTLKPGDFVENIPILIGTFRCGPHELSASQQTFLLSAYARTPRVPTQRLILVPPAPLRAKAQKLLVDVCLG
jgi:hypothetical protein